MKPDTALKPAVFHILLALLPGGTHGYAIMQAVHEQSGGQVPLRTASLYRHLNSLIEAGLVETTKRPAGDDARRGDYYKLTRSGQQLLGEERERLARIVSALDALKVAPKRTRP